MRVRPSCLCTHLQQACKLLGQLTGNRLRLVPHHYRDDHSDCKRGSGRATLWTQRTQVQSLHSRICLRTPTCDTCDGCARTQAAAYPVLYDEANAGCRIPDMPFGGHGAPTQSLKITLLATNRTGPAPTWLPTANHTLTISSYAGATNAWVHVSGGAPHTLTPTTLPRRGSCCARLANKHTLDAGASGKTTPLQQYVSVARLYVQADSLGPAARLAASQSHALWRGTPSDRPSTTRCSGRRPRPRRPRA